MTYTKKTIPPLMVTFTVSWIVEEITIPALDEMRGDTLAECAALNDYRPLIDELPEGLGTLMETASMKEISELLANWQTATDKAKRNAAHTDSLFRRIVKGM
jgi:hypothetical protein